MVSKPLQSPDSSSPTSPENPEKPGLWRRVVRSKTVLGGLGLVAALAVAGTTYGYSQVDDEVTLSVDGKPSTVGFNGETVADLLDAQDIELGEHDVVAPSLDAKVQDGSKVSVRYARPLTLTIDGEKKEHWVLATDVDAALDELGRSYGNSDLSASRSASIDRDGMALDVITPKTVKVKVGAAAPKKQTVTALTASDVLEEQGVEVHKNDEVTPAPNAEVSDGDTVVLTRVRVQEDTVRGEEMDFKTVEQDDDSMYEGEDEVEREGVTGLRDATYRKTFRNGKLVKTTLVSSELQRKPVSQIVRVGTKEEPADTAVPTGDTGVWDSLAACEAGGNWAINTGNGYYGGLQFNLGTWRAYGGAGYPHQQSREYQISIAEKVRAATGGYGSWPACASSLGLPR